MVIFSILFWRCPTLWKLTLKMTTCFDVGRTLFSLTLKNTKCCFNVVQRCKFQRRSTQRCFNVDLTLCDIATLYQPEYNVEPTLKCLLWCDEKLIWIFCEPLFWNLFFVQNWHVLYFLYHLSAFHNSSSARIKFIICTCFDNKLLIFLFLWKCTFQAVCTGQDISFRITATSLRHLLWKMLIQVLLMLHFGVYFSLEGVLQNNSKNNPTENNSMPKFKWHGNMQQLKNVHRRKGFRGYHSKL